MKSAFVDIDGLGWHPDGYASLTGDLLDQACCLDNEFRRWASEMGCVSHQFPGLIALADLAPTRYIGSFPHLATFAVSARRNSGNLDAMARENADSSSIPASFRLGPARHVLTPAACYHFYHRLAGKDLEEDLKLTTACDCYRCEASYAPLARQHCFRMRELVCIGQAAVIDAFVEECLQRVQQLLSRIGLKADWQTASDPFFDPENDPAALMQRVHPTKRELCLDDGLAIASVNRHGEHFGVRYDIRRNGSAAESACVAFGMERWLLALARRFGPHPVDWPALGTGP